MFERFTGGARTAVVHAQEEARNLGHDRIDPGHLLIAIAHVDGSAARVLRACHFEVEELRTKVKREIDGLDPDALASIGIDLDEVRRATEASFGEGALDKGSGKPQKGHIPFTPDSKKVLELSLRVAIKNKDKFICSGHILLAMLMLPESVPVRILQGARVNFESLRTELAREIAIEEA